MLTAWNDQGLEGKPESPGGPGLPANRPGAAGTVSRHFAIRLVLNPSERTSMFRRKLLALAGAGVAAGALALGAAGVANAAPMITPVSVTVTPNHVSGQAGTPISDLVVTDNVDSWLQNAGVAPTLSTSGLPGGLHLDSTSAPTTISGTPSAAGDGTFTVIATAVEPKDPNWELRLTGDFAGCSYSLVGPATVLIDSNTQGGVTTSDTLSGAVIVDPTNGESISYTLTHTVTGGSSPSSESITYTNKGLSALNQAAGAKEGPGPYTITKTCVADAVVTYAFSKAPTPTPTVTVTPPPSTPLSGAPSGGVQTGGGLPVHHSNGLWALWLIPMAGAGALAAAFAARKPQRTQG